jgi:hypothetical protein
MLLLCAGRYEACWAFGPEEEPMDRITPNPDAVDPEFPQLAETSDEEFAVDPDDTDAADEDDDEFDDEDDEDEEQDEQVESESQGSE